MALLLGSLLLGAACIKLDLGDKKSDPSAGSADAGTDDASVGIDCIAEPTTGETICTGTTVCPGLNVDHDLFPSCGWRIRGATLDLQCACGNGDLCPIGTPSTCSEAQTLLNGQTQWTVCLQQDQGRCTKPGAQAPASRKTCDEDCLIRCGGDAACGKRCGC